MLLPLLAQNGREPAVLVNSAPDPWVHLTAS